MLKHELRKCYLQKRIDLSDQEKVDLDMKIKSRFESYLPNDVKTVHSYLPILPKREIDTWTIIQGLWSKNIKVVVPLVTNKNKINSHLLTRETPIKVNGWKIPEPVNSSFIENNAIDAVIIPLLAYDKYGNRVGYGKGIYDSFLSSLDREVLKIGLSYFPPVDKIIDLAPWDIPLDVCITPEQLIKF